MAGQCLAREYLFHTYTSTCMSHDAQHFSMVPQHLAAVISRREKAWQDKEYSRAHIYGEILPIPHG